MANSRGYGTLPMFSGEGDTFELWCTKFKGMLRLQKLHDVIEGTGEVSADKNANVYAYLVNCLDDQSLNLIMRDADNDGRKAYQILQEHYLSTSKPRIIALYTELTTLKMTPTETVTDYMLRAETAFTRLKQADEEISEKLLIAMILKGLPERYRAFSTIITNNDDIDFKKFKSQLKKMNPLENPIQVMK